MKYGNICIYTHSSSKQLLSHTSGHHICTLRVQPVRSYPSLVFTQACENNSPPSSSSSYPTAHIFSPIYTYCWLATVCCISSSYTSISLPPTPTYMGTHLQSGLLLGRSGLLCNPLLYLHNLVAVIGMIGVMRIQEVELGVPSLIQSDTPLKLRSYKYTVNTHCTCMSLEDGMYTHKQPNSPKKKYKKKTKRFGQHFQFLVNLYTFQDLRWQSDDCWYISAVFSSRCTCR